MFCGECGTQNDRESLFCSNCGKPLVHDNNGPAKVKQPMSKNKKILIAVLVIVALLLGGGYKIGSDMTSPKKVAGDYITALVNKDGNKLYNYLDLEGDKTFVSKKIFNNLLKESDTTSTELESYKINEVEYSEDGDTAKVKFSYTLKGSTREKTDTVKLVKQEDKKFLVFDNWKVSDLSASNTTMKDFKIKVLDGTVVTYAGVKVSSKYLDDESASGDYVVYKLPQVFTTKTELKAVLPGGMEIEDKVTPSSYNSTYTVRFNKNNLSTDVKNKITNKSKEVLSTIYDSAVAKKQFSEIKSNFEHGKLDLSNLETAYNKLVSNLASSSTTLTSIDFTNVSLYDIDLTKDGNYKVEVKVNYDYSVSYTSYGSDEVKTHDDTDYDYMIIILSCDKNDYYLVDAEDLDYYFSRY